MVQVETDNPAFALFCQLIAAFGQGAGGMKISRETMAEITRQYWPVISRQTDLDEGLLQALEYARGLGRLAAHRALAQGYTFVRVDDFQAVSDELRQDSARSDNCPYC